MAAKGQQQKGFADYEDRHIDENHPYDGSGFAPRTCTDLFCLVLFVLYLFGMGCITADAFRNGDPRRLTHGFDYKGHLCGVDPIVQGKPLLYWCGAGHVAEDGVPVALDLKFPTCVAACPMDTRTDMVCLGVEQVQLGNTGEKPYLTEKTIIMETTAKQMSYPTYEFRGRYCLPHLAASNLPQNDALTASLMGSQGILQEPWFKLGADLGGFRRCWLVIGGSMLLAIFLGYTYLLLLTWNTKLVVDAILFLLILGFALGGIFFLIGDFLSGGTLGRWEASNLLFRQYALDNARTASRLAGFGCLVTSLALVCLICYAQDAWRAGIGCVEASRDCILSMPSLLILPLLEALWKLCLGLFLLNSLAWLLSTANMRPDFISVKDEVVGGLTRSLVLSPKTKVMAACYIFGAFWLLELANAVSQFVISYSVVLWYYTPKPKGFGPHIPLVRGFIVGIVFHLGTLALGALLVAICRPPRLMLALINKQAASGDNIVCEVLRQCTSSCDTFFHRYLEPLSKNAYIDVCISSTSFCAAAKNSSVFIRTEGGSVLAMTGACFIYCITGVLGISAAVAEFAYILVATNSWFTDDDSLQYVADPLFITAICAILGASIAISFMVVFDHSADTLLYTYVWNKSHGHNTVQKYAPDVLAMLTDYRPLPKPNRGPAQREGGRFHALSSLFSSTMHVKASSHPEEQQALMRTQ